MRKLGEESAAKILKLDEAKLLFAAAAAARANQFRAAAEVLEEGQSSQLREDFFPLREKRAEEKKVNRAKVVAAAAATSGTATNYKMGTGKINQCNSR